MKHTADEWKLEVATRPMQGRRSWKNGNVNIVDWKNSKFLSFLFTSPGIFFLIHYVLSLSNQKRIIARKNGYY